MMAAALTLAGCGRGSKQDVLGQVKDAKTKADVEKVLGKPDDTDKLGPMETWTYKVSNGNVNLRFLGDKLLWEDTADKQK